MNSKIETQFKKEIEIAKQKMSEKDFDLSFRHLERAHVIGQNYVSLHTISHYHMLRHGVFSGNIKEIIGQIIRLPLGILGSAIGIVPTGNTGGANVAMFKKMPIDPELKLIMKKDNSIES
ncbi:MAG: DUF3703 domain-containing protein [Bdellovibrionota bacterium]|nr:DUF3703 domain-containing protein [Bdellovibrionota bacterium]